MNFRTRTCLSRRIITVQPISKTTKKTSTPTFSPGSNGSKETVDFKKVSLTKASTTSMTVDFSTAAPSTIRFTKRQRLPSHRLWQHSALSSSASRPTIWRPFPHRRAPDARNVKSKTQKTISFPSLHRKPSSKIWDDQMIKPKKCFISNIFSQINSNGSSFRGCHSADKGIPCQYLSRGNPHQEKASASQITFVKRRRYSIKTIWRNSIRVYWRWPAVPSNDERRTFVWRWICGIDDVDFLFVCRSNCHQYSSSRSDRNECSCVFTIWLRCLLIILLIIH